MEKRKAYDGDFATKMLFNVTMLDGVRSIVGDDLEEACET
jgi:hypothetical protein